MARPPSVSYEQFVAACARIEKRGEPLSVRRVQRELGSGSMTTLHAYLQRLQSSPGQARGASAPQRKTASGPQLKETLARADQAEQRILQLEADLAQKEALVAGLNDQLGALSVRAEAAEQAPKKAQRRGAKSSVRIGGREIASQDLAAELLTKRQQAAFFFDRAETMEARAKKAEKEVLELRSQLRDALGRISELSMQLLALEGPAASKVPL